MKTRNYIIIYSIAAFMFVGCYKKQKEGYDTSSLLYILAFESFAKVDAAVKTATNNCNCTRIMPYYWEIGNANGKIVSGKFPNVFNSYPWDETTAMDIASASKLIWGAYALEKKGTAPGADEDNYLRMLSGYTNMPQAISNCHSTDTVGVCFATGSNNVQTVGNENMFFYNSGHFEAYAVNVLSLSSYTCAQLATEVMNYLGTDLNLTYTLPIPAGAGNMTPASYRSFLMKILKGQLMISQYLGLNPTCAQTGETQPDGSPCINNGVAYTPLPPTIKWHYSYAHWLEDDPTTGDGSFSSPGLFGFYPWINKDKTLYGIVARVDLGAQAYAQSVYCGGLIRKAYVEGKEQTDECIP